MKNRNLNKKEIDQLKRLKLENQKLKKELSSLRKQLSRLDLQSERYVAINDLIDKQYEEEKKTKEAAKLRKKWQCHKCDDGVLKLIIIRTPSSVRYFRKCTHCVNRTRVQDYHDKVEGVK